MQEIFLGLKKITKETEDYIVKNVRNIFKRKNKNKAIKQRIIIEIRNHSELGEDYYKSVRAINFYSNNYIEYKSNDDRNKTLTIP